MTEHGRGAWTKEGMPINAKGYYELLTPVHVGANPEKNQSFRAVWWGVHAIQLRINRLGYNPHVRPDGNFGPLTDKALRWAQKNLNISDDGRCGPITAKALFYPVVETVAKENAQIVGSIVHLESGFDPGAVGFVTNSDLGLAQINLAANPLITENQAFDYRYAIEYISQRITNALNFYTNRNAAIVSYNSPLWAKQWQATGKSPNETAEEYVKLVLSWKP